MKERPILFSAPMVRALLDGTKTQTRRSVKGWALEWLAPGMFTPEYVASPENHACPYGKPGDRLWVREAWRTDPQFDYLPPRDLDPSVAPVQYEAGPHADVLGGKLRPSMFMPRWACRLVLTLESVRVERLNDISEADAQAEGIESYALNGGQSVTGGLNLPTGYYRYLWESINGPGSWDANPWVWVLAFRCGPNLRPNA